MKDISLKIKKFFQKIKKLFNKNSHEYWNIIIRVSFIIIIILICFSLFLLYQIKTEKIINRLEVEKEPIKIIKEDTLNKVNSYFEEKEKKSENVKNEPFPFKDPSIE